MDSKPPEALTWWLERLTILCRRPTLGAVGLYLGGSACTGGFQVDVSDVDVILVVKSPVGVVELDRLCADLNELGSPPAAGGLDLDIFTCGGLQHPDPDPGWRSWVRWTAGGTPVFQGDSLQLSDWAPALAIARERAIALFGRPPFEAFGPIPRRLVLQACREELAEWDRYQSFWSLPGGVLTACRVWWYSAEGRFGSRSTPVGGPWAAPRRRIGR